MNKIKLICFDLNKTLIVENTWEDLNIAMGMTKEEDQVLFDLWEEGVISYIEWQKILENIYKVRGKANKDTIQKCVFQYRYMTDAKEIIRYLQQKGYTLALITGSLEMLAEKVARELDIEHFASNNKLIFDANDYLDRLKVVGEDEETKLAQLQSICDKLHVNITKVACIGDGDNDVLMFEKCKHGVTFLGSKIKDKAWKVIGDLGDIRNIF